jgi:hypothetical protein
MIILIKKYLNARLSKKQRTTQDSKPLLTAQTNTSTSNGIKIKTTVTVNPAENFNEWAQGIHAQIDKNYKNKINNNGK